MEKNKKNFADYLAEASKREQFNNTLFIWLNFIEDLVVLGFIACIIYFKEISDWWIILAIFIFLIVYGLNAPKKKEIQK